MCGDGRGSERWLALVHVASIVVVLEHFVPSTNAYCANALIHNTAMSGIEYPYQDGPRTGWPVTNPSNHSSRVSGASEGKILARSARFFEWRRKRQRRKIVSKRPRICTA